MPDPISTPVENRGELVAEKRDDQSTDLAPLQIIRTETVLSKLPIHNLAKRGRVSIQITKRNELGEIDVQWKVSASEEYGTPRQLAYKLDTVVINRRVDELTRPLPKIIRLGTLRQLCKELNLHVSGDNANDLKRALHQNAGAYITAKLNYKGNDGTERRLEAGFTRYSVIFTGEHLPNGKEADAVYLILNDPYWEVLNTAPVRPLNYDYLKALPPAPQRFYEVISFRMFTAIKYHHKHVKFLYSEYCTFSAQTRSYDWNFVRPQMYRVHKPHLQSGYLKKVTFEPTTDSDGNLDWIMYYVPGPKARAEYSAFNRKHLIESEGEVIDVEPSKPQEAGERGEAQPQAAGETAPTVESPAGPATSIPEAEPTTPTFSPLQLVQYFHKQARGKDNYQPHEGSKELSQATGFLANWGEEKARFIVDFAVQEAKKTHFKMRTFGAVFQYYSEALAEYDYREMERQQAQTRQAREADRQRREIEQEREAEELLAKLPPDEYQRMYDEVKVDLMMRYPQAASYLANVLDETIKANMVKELKRRATTPA